MVFFDRQVFSADMTALPLHVMCTKMSKVFFLGGCLDLFETHLLIARSNRMKKEGEIFLLPSVNLPAVLCGSHPLGP